jgi:hypothetical protein
MVRNELNAIKEKTSQVIQMYKDKISSLETRIALLESENQLLK